MCTATPTCCPQSIPKCAQQAPHFRLGSCCRSNRPSALQDVKGEGHGTRSAAACRAMSRENPRISKAEMVPTFFPFLNPSIPKKRSWYVLVDGSASLFHMPGLLSMFMFSWPLVTTGMLDQWTLPCSKSSIDQDFQQCGRRRKVPSPEQGTSQITLSYLWPNIPCGGQDFQVG